MEAPIIYHDVKEWHLVDRKEEELLMEQSH